MEGTTVGRSSTSAPLDEAGVEEDLRRLFRSASGAAIVFASAQNIDRLVSVYRAAKRADRTLVVDLYGATIATASGNANIPQPGLGFDLRVYVPNRQRVLVKESGEFTRVDKLGRERIFLTEMAVRAGELVILTQASTLPELARAGVLVEAVAAWSLWPGYLDRDRRVAPLLDQNGVPLAIVHASGHARVDDLQLLATAVGASRVVPIHTSARERYADLFTGVELHDDGEWWDV
jgi:ribonuclease J